MLEGSLGYTVRPGQDTNRLWQMPTFLSLSLNMKVEHVHSPVFSLKNPTKTESANKARCFSAPSIEVAPHPSAPGMPQLSDGETETWGD